MGKTAVIYTRVSTDDQAENGYSLRDQELRLRKYCRDKDIQIINHYQDDHSAKSFDRPQFKEFLKDIRLKKIKPDIFLCTRIDRFGRNAMEAWTMMVQFKKWGIEFSTIENNISLDTPESLIPLILSCFNYDLAEINFIPEDIIKLVFGAFKSLFTQ